LADGRVALALGRTWSDGTTHFVFEPLELLERLAVLVPRPRINMVLSHDVLAGHAKERAAAVGEPAGGESREGAAETLRRVRPAAQRSRPRRRLPPGASGCPRSHRWPGPPTSREATPAESGWAGHHPAPACAAPASRSAGLGWPSEQVVVIDSDLGQSGASATDREGFQKLVAEVGLGRAGIVLGLEVSRLARNSADGHRLIEICALTDTLIPDEDGVYDPAHFNDRLLLDLQGTRSGAELHVLRACLIGGILNKARRGELRCRLPVDLVYAGDGRAVLDPDKQVQETVLLLFSTFARTGSVHATIKYLRRQRLLFPTRIAAGARKGGADVGAAVSGAGRSSCFWPPRS